MMRGFQPGYRWRHGVCACLLLVVNLILWFGTSDAVESTTRQPDTHASAEPQRLHPCPVLLVSERTRSSMVGTIMALLATFDEAGILPPEGTAQANQLIHGLIQLQSALMKSESPELAAYRMAAEAQWVSEHQDVEDGGRETGELTSNVLAMLMSYDHMHPLWEDPKVVAAMQAFNVTHADWIFMRECFHQADAVLRKQGRSIHTVYESWRMKMPGVKS